MRENRIVFLTGLLLCVRVMAMDATPVGLWKTIDDNTHKPRALVRLYEQNGEIFGKIEASLDPKEAGEVCAKCAGERKGMPVLGMVVVRHMKRRGNEYAEGDILDPDTGWVYKCKFTLEEGGKILVVRGFIGFSLLGRSQTWYRQQ
jgi:uncharacterized protein (DUF2147 family)